MSFYPFDLLHLRPDHVLVWLVLEPIPQGCGGFPQKGDTHPRYPDFKAVTVSRPSDCLGGEVEWEAPFNAAPTATLRMLTAIPAPAPEPVCENCGANGCPELKTWSFCAACRE